MNAIHVRYTGATDTRGSRMIATASAPEGRLSIPYPYEAGEGEAAHRVAAEALADRLGWSDGYALAGGRLPDGSYAFVLVEKDR